MIRGFGSKMAKCLEFPEFQESSLFGKISNGERGCRKLGGPFKMVFQKKKVWEMCPEVRP